METQTLNRGGSFIVNDTVPSNIFTPEDYTEEHIMLRQAMRTFLDKEIEPIKTDFDSKKGIEIAPSKLELLGEMDFLGLSVPTEYGGLGLDFKSEAVHAEIMADGFSFAQTLGVQKGLGIYSMLFYGNEEQINKYLPGILKGKIKCSYCLTEPGSGSDANSGKTKAIYSEDKKHFILNGQKMWITNAGFADLFTVFCKIEDDENLSCLIVEKDWGVTLGAEEDKIGIHGSSTRQVFFENIKVPAENLLGERNKGFKIAMNALNVGRLTVGIGGCANSKRAFRLGVEYANQRVQFGQSIASFGAIQEKIARMAAKIYSLESSWNRIVGDIDTYSEMLISDGHNNLESKQKAASEFAMECAMIKVLGSETEAFIVDESLQIHGGIGYSNESEIAIIYRNIRGNRIYEGTNEINRLLISSTLLKRALKGQVPLMQAIMNINGQLHSGVFESFDYTDKNQGALFVKKIKETALLVCGQAVQVFQQKIKEEQEVLMNISDVMIQIFALESALLRSEKNGSDVHRKLTILQAYETATICSEKFKELIFSCNLSADTQQKLLSAAQKTTALPSKNLKELRRDVAKYFIEKQSYNFQ
ncbi:MAG: acyl-CoA dehydrogenase family protein [Flavobacteriales bacterium]|nr:acyl-CoA dehydrogenase family protein [Flavobacteriales bacterium]